MAVKKTTTRKTTAKATESKVVEPIVESVVEEAIEEVEVVNQPVKRKRVSVDRKTEVVIMNNTAGRLIYIDPRTQMTYDMSSYGDTEYITVEELLNMKNRHKAILEKFWALIIDVEDDDIEVSDVLTYLGLDRLYEQEKPKNLDDILLKLDYREFVKVIDSISLTMFQRIMERAVDLFKQDKFNDFSKIKHLQDKVKNEYVFERDKE